jgi:hypothetical protein
VGGWRYPETHRSVYTLSRRLEYLQRRRDTFSLSSLLVERAKSAVAVSHPLDFIVSSFLSYPVRVEEFE